MLEEVFKLTRRPYYYVISFIYESYCETNFVTCNIRRPYIKHLAVQTVSDTEENALLKTLKLLEKVIELDSKSIIEPPPLHVQPIVKGYYRQTYNNDIDVLFQRTLDLFIITNVIAKNITAAPHDEKPIVLTNYKRFSDLLL